VRHFSTRLRNRCQLLRAMALPHRGTFGDATSAGML
jgi:hypothetical protein